VLSRIARGLHELGRYVERAQHVVRVLEVNHKMNLERTSQDDSNVWTAIAEAFECTGLDHPTEADVYGELVLSRTHPWSVRYCVEHARDEGRAMREHISEELWLHLNRTHLELQPLRFDDILGIGRSEFNRRIEIFSDAFAGLADDTLIRGEAWSFLRIGRLGERAAMVCRILRIKLKSLSAGHEGAALDVHQWQTLLRSLSGYEPYRRIYDARIVPERVLEFVIKQAAFPRSLVFTLSELSNALRGMPRSNALQMDVDRDLSRLVEELRLLDTSELIASGSLEAELRRIDHCCRNLTDGLELGYFTTRRPTSAPIAAWPGSILVPQ